MGVTTNVRYVRVKVRYPSPTAHFASLRLRTPTLERSALEPRLSLHSSTFYMITFLGLREQLLTSLNEIKSPATEDTTPMSDRYETQPKIASGLQQSAHKGLSHPTTLCATPA